MINVLLVEDHTLVIEGIESMLEKESDINCMAYCTTAATMWHSLGLHTPDVILLDINLPDANGIDLCREIKNKYPSIKLLALSINNQPGIIRQMMSSGADGFLLKDADKQEIITGIRTVMQRKTYYSRSVVATLRKPQANSLPALTRREKEVLTLIAEGLTNRQIAAKLFIDVTTVDSHRKNMLSKYGVNNTSALIKLAIQEQLLDL